MSDTSSVKPEWTGRKYMGLSGSKLSRMIGVASGAGFLLFGYDQGVMGSLLTLKAFNKQFPEIDTGGSGYNEHKAVMQGTVISIYEIGCLIGALSCMFIGDRLGRRKVIYLGVIWMVVGTILQCTSFGITQLAIARVVTGVGNGMNTATIPTWQSECSPAHMRGKLIMIEGALITGGIMISYWIDFAFYWIEAKNAGHADASWRVPIALQILLCLPTAILTIKCPESPRWLMLRGDEQGAREVMSSLEELPPDHPDITLKVDEMKESLAAVQKTSIADIFTNGRNRNFHRTALGFMSQMFQQISGINLITYYAGTIFQQNLGFSSLISRVMAAANGTEYFAASWIAVWLVERTGRRPLMLFGALGQCLTMVVLTITNHPNITHPVFKPEIGALGGTNTAASVIATICLFLFNTFFAIGWLGMTWLTPAEMTPLNIRAAANGISTASNWSFNFLIVMITPIAFHNIGTWTYFIFAVINLVILITTYFTIPETAGRSLEEMDDIFAASSKSNPYDVVLVERRTPRRYDQFGNLLASHPADAEMAVVSQDDKTSTHDSSSEEKKAEDVRLHTETSPVLN